MAILPSIPGLTVTIEVADRATKEYDDPDADSMQTDMQAKDFDLPAPLSQTTNSIPYIVKYIEAKPRALFAFKVTLSKRFPHRAHHVAYKVVTDGSETSTVHITKKCRVERRGLILLESTTDGTAARTPGGSHISRKFCFASLDVGRSHSTQLRPNPLASMGADGSSLLVESDHFSAEEVRKQMARAKQCGVLKVLLYHMEDSNGQYRPSGTSIHHESSTESRTAMAEKAFKGRAIDCVTGSVSCVGPVKDPQTSFFSSPSDNGVVYSTVLQTSEGPPRHLVDIHHDQQKRPFAIFEFRYRSKDGLVKEGIIPPPTISDKVEEMSEGEVRRKLAGLLEQNQRRSRQEQDAKPSRGVKREADKMEVDDWAPDPTFEARYRTRRLSHGKMEIDLTYN